MGHKEKQKGKKKRKKRTKGGKKLHQRKGEYKEHISEAMERQRRKIRVLIKHML